MIKPEQILNTQCITYEKIIPPKMAQLFLPLYLKHPAALKLRDAGIGFAGISDAIPGFRIRRKPDFFFGVFTCFGVGEITVDGETRELTPGSVYLAPQGREQFYRQKGDQSWRFLWFHLKNAPCLQPAPDRAAFGSFGNCAQLEAAMNGLAVETMRTMQSLVNSDEQPPWHFYNDSMDLNASLRTFQLETNASNRNAEHLAGLYAELILGLLDRAFHSLYERFDDDDRAELFDQLWNHVLGALERKWELQNMAELVHMSVPTLIRQVKRRYDATPMQMLYHLRLKRAVQLLLSSRLPISSIASQIGYDSLASFSTAFRKEYGVTPCAYREAQTAATIPQ